MTYKDFINNIIKVRGRVIYDDEYHEVHHVVPRCKNGTDDENNLIDLYAKEHFIAHKLLAEENPDDDQLVYAYALMAFVKDKNQKRYELTPEEYEEARRTFSQKNTGSNNPSAKKVMRLSDDKIYVTIKECGKDNNISPSMLSYRLKKHRDFVYYDEWLSMSETERQQIKAIDWRAVEHFNRSQAAKMAGSGGSIMCSEETRRKIGEANKNKGIKVYCPELDEEFITMKAASIKYGVNETSIGYCLCGKQKHAGRHPVTGELLTWVKIGK